MRMKYKMATQTIVSNKEKEVERIDHPRECYVVEEVGGKTIYTSWDREEAFQLADSLLISGKETRNNLAVRRVACSLILPPMTEIGKAAAPVNKKVMENASSCPTNTFPTVGYCIEKFDLPNNIDIGSFVRRKMGDHYIVCVGDTGSWDPIKEKYYTKPRVYEVWHPKNEKNCPVKLKPNLLEHKN